MSLLPETLVQNIMWNGDKNPIWVGSTLHLCRNLSLYKFPSKMSTAEMEGSLKTILETFQKSSSTQPFLFFPAEKLSSLDKELLFEHFHCPQGFQQTGQGQGFGIDAESSVLITLNHHDHLQFHSVNSAEDLIGAWGHLCQIEEEIGNTQLYAFSSRFGFLTANPMLCGTTLEARLFLHIPALRHTEELHKILQNQKEEQLIFASLEGPLEDLVGDFLIIKNRYTLGISEETVLSLLKTTALKIALAEKTARDALTAKPSPHIKDFIGRAFGLLMHSYELHPKEAIDALSAVKLGVDLSWVAGIAAQKLSSLILQLRRGHLSHLLHLEAVDAEMLARKRAEWLHQELKGMSLVADLGSVG